MSSTTPSAAPISFAYWVPNVSGGLVISNIEQRTSWDIGYNRKLAQIAEKAGFDYALTQIRFTAGYGAEYQHESVSFTHALLAATEKLKVIAAVLPGPWSPVVLGKQVATISHMTGGRIAVNIVSGWFRGEFDAIGLPWLEHDERYKRSEEFIRVLQGIWTVDSFTFNGQFYQFRDYSLKPKPLDPLPEIFQGGSSRAARDMASRVSDWYFTNGNTPEEIKKQVDDIRAKAAVNHHKVKIGVNGFVIARDTEEEARKVLAEIIEKANPEAVKAFGHEVKNAGAASPEGVGNWAKSSFEDLVQYNDGFRTNLIGTPQQIAERIYALKNVGVDLVLLAFLHFQEEVEYFGKHVMPLVRALEGQKSWKALQRDVRAEWRPTWLGASAANPAWAAVGEVAPLPAHHSSGVVDRAAAVLALEGISLQFGGIRALTDVNLDLHADEILAVIGPNGAGKSSLINVISGLYAPDQGVIRFGGQAFEKVPTGRLAALGVARTFQNIALFKGMSVLDNVVMGRVASVHSTTFEQILGLRRSRMERDTTLALAHEVIGFLHLSSLYQRPVGTLSYGAQKRVELARALVAKPRLLLLDEPMAGMTAGEKQEMAAFIRDARDRFGTAIILIEHDIGVVMGLSDRVAVLDYGRKIADGTPAEVRADSAVIDAYLGVAHVDDEAAL